VLGDGEPWPVATFEEEEEGDDEAADEPAAADELEDELVVAVPAELLEPAELRLPRSRGAISAANRSAETTPLTRMVF